MVMLEGSRGDIVLVNPGVGEGEVGKTALISKHRCFKQPTSHLTTQLFIKKNS